MSDFAELLRIVERMSRELRELKHLTENTVREAVVDEVDAKKGYKLDFGKDENGKPIPSTWLPHPEQGGAFKTWRPSSKGQIVYVLSPGGDQRRAFLVPKGGFSDDNPAPSEKLDENVETFGKVRTTWKADGTTKQVGDRVTVTTTTESNTVKTEKASVTTGPAKHTILAENTKLEADGGKVLAAAKVFRATEKVILASG